MKQKVYILGGGFGGVYTAMELERQLANDPNIEITLVNRDNFFLFTPMLHEVAASDLELTTIVNPVRKLLRKVQLFAGEVDHIDLRNSQLTLSHGFRNHSHTVPYDRLILALGSITNFYNLPGLADRALTIKSLGDAVGLRNRLIAHLEEADTDCAKDEREPLLTFVVRVEGLPVLRRLPRSTTFFGKPCRSIATCMGRAFDSFWSTPAPLFFRNLDQSWANTPKPNWQNVESRSS